MANLAELAISSTVQAGRRSRQVVVPLLLGLWKRRGPGAARRSLLIAMLIEGAHIGGVESLRAGCGIVALNIGQMEAPPIVLGEIVG